MKHYVLANDRADLAKTGPEVPERIKYIDVILSDTRALASAEIVVEFYHALNSLVENCSYVVNLRVSGNDSVGGPLYWAGRTAIFWGDLENNWDVSGSRRSDAKGAKPVPVAKNQRRFPGSKASCTRVPTGLGRRMI